jgi:hypothetical protein
MKEEFSSAKNYIKFSIKLLILVQVINFFVCGSVAVVDGGNWDWSIFGEVALILSACWLMAVVFGPFIGRWIAK